MNDTAENPSDSVARFQSLRKPLQLALTLLALALVLASMGASGGVYPHDETLRESTLGKLAAWMADQSGKEADELLSPLARYADHWANELGDDALDPEILFISIRNFRLLYYGAIILMLVYAAMTIMPRPRAGAKTPVRRHPDAGWPAVLRAGARWQQRAAALGIGDPGLARRLGGGAGQGQPGSRFLSGAVLLLRRLGSGQSLRRFGKLQNPAATTALELSNRSDDGRGAGGSRRGPGGLRHRRSQSPGRLDAAASAQG